MSLWIVLPVKQVWLTLPPPRSMISLAVGKLAGFAVPGMTSFLMSIPSVYGAIGYHQVCIPLLCP